jgi:hypothetical protein
MGGAMENRTAIFLALALLGAAPAWGVTLGETSTGNDSYTPSLNVVRMSQYVCPSNGNINRILLYLPTATGSGRVAVYRDDPNGNTPTSLVVSSGEQALVTEWNTFVVPSTSLTGGQIYWLACAFSDSPAIAFRNDDPYDYKAVTHDMTYGPFPDPFVPSLQNNFPYRYCLYATEVLDTPTFTPSATPTATPTGTPSRTQTGTPSPTSTRPASATPSPLSTPPATGTITPTATLTPPATATAAPTLLSLDPNSVITYPSPAAKNDVWFYYSAPAGVRVNIDIFNSAGEQVTVLGGQTTVAGFQRTHWDSRSVSPGVYLYRLTWESSAGRRDLGLRKLVVVK